MDHKTKLQLLSIFLKYPVLNHFTVLVEIEATRKLEQLEDYLADSARVPPTQEFLQIVLWAFELVCSFKFDDCSGVGVDQLLPDTLHLIAVTING